MTPSAREAPPFGVSGYTTHGFSLAHDLTLCQDLKISYLELCEAKVPVRGGKAALEMLQNSGLVVSSVQPRLHSLFPDAPRPLPVSPAARMARLSKSIETLAPYFPGTTFVTIPGAAPDYDFARAYRVAVTEYKQVVRRAEDLGVRVALEPLNPILMNVDTFICTLRDALRVVEAVDSPAFGVWLDVWHVWEEAGILDTVTGCGPHIFGVHINDWKTPRALGDRFLPGDGDIPLVPLLRAVHQSGYRGVYTLELFSELRLPGSLWRNPRRTVERGQAAFARLWPDVLREEN